MKETEDTSHLDSLEVDLFHLQRTRKALLRLIADDNLTEETKDPFRYAQGYLQESIESIQKELNK